MENISVFVESLNHAPPDHLVVPQMSLAKNAVKNFNRRRLDVDARLPQSQWVAVAALLVAGGVEDRGGLGRVVLEAERVALGESASVVELAAGQWHAVLSQDSGAVIFEVKHGPYLPTEPADFAPWVADPTDSADAQSVLAAYAAARVGQPLAINR